MNEGYSLTTQGKGLQSYSSTAINRYRLMGTTTAEQLLANLHGLTFIDGTLVDKDTHEQFQFNKFRSHSDNVARFDEIGEFIREITYTLLEQQGLQRVHCPVVNTEDKTFFFMSDDALSNPNKLMVIIHGSGAVRAGQWSRRIIINERNGLEKGTQLPFIRRAQSLGYGIIVMNTNFNEQQNQYEFLTSPEDHASFIWKNYVLLSAARKVVIVAHSYGGQVTSTLAQQYREYFQRYVRAVAFSDAVSFYMPTKFDAAFFNERSRNWVASHLPVGTPLGIRSVSAGDDRHEYTPWSSFDDTFEYIENRVQLPSDKMDGVKIEHENRFCRSSYCSILIGSVVIILIVAVSITGFALLRR